MPGSCLPSTLTDHLVKPGDDGEEHIRMSRNGTASHSTPAPPRTWGRPLTLTVKTDSPDVDRLAHAVMPSVVASRKWTSAQTSVPSSVPEKVPDLGAAVPKSQSNFDGMTEVVRRLAVARASVTARS